VTRVAFFKKKLFPQNTEQATIFIFFVGEFRPFRLTEKARNSVQAIPKKYKKFGIPIRTPNHFRRREIHSELRNFVISFRTISRKIKMLRIPFRTISQKRETHAISLRKKKLLETRFKLIKNEEKHLDVKKHFFAEFSSVSF
jgi:hypothetical protein